MALGYAEVHAELKAARKRIEELERDHLAWLTELHETLDNAGCPRVERDGDSLERVHALKRLADWIGNRPDCPKCDTYRELWKRVNGERRELERQLAQAEAEVPDCVRRWRALPERSGTDPDRETVIQWDLSGNDGNLAQDAARQCLEWLATAPDPAAAHVVAGADDAGVPECVRPEVAAFALLMETELRHNDHKPGWKKDHPSELATRVAEEADELREAVARYELAVANGPPRDADIIAKLARIAAAEAADVANMAMMVADTLQQLTTHASAIAHVVAADGDAKVLREWQHEVSPQPGEKRVGKVRGPIARAHIHSAADVYVLPRAEVDGLCNAWQWPARGSADDCARQLRALIAEHDNPEPPKS